MKLAFGRFYNKNSDISYNFKKILKLYEEAVRKNIEIVIFPRLAISGFSVNESFYNDKFLATIDKYLEKIIAATTNKETKILIDSPFFEQDAIDNNEKYINARKLRDSAILASDGCIDTIIFRKEIDKNNKLDDYKYFDKNSFLKYFFHKKKKFAVLISDDIYNDFNIVLTIDSKPDYIICLDSSSGREKIEKHLIKLSKFVKSPVLYMNNSTYLNGMLFDGKIIMVNENYEIVVNNNYERDCLLEFELDCADGTELFIDDKPKQNNDIYYVLEKYFGKKSVIVDVDKYHFNVKNNKKYKMIKFSDSCSKYDCNIINLDNYINKELYDKLNEKEKNMIKNKIIDIL